MVKHSTLLERLREYPFLKIVDGNLKCSICEVVLEPSTTTVKRHSLCAGHLQAAANKVAKENLVERIKQKTLLENLPENMQFLRDLACVMACTGTASIHAPTILQLFQKYASAESVMDPTYKITPDDINAEQRKQATKVKGIITGLGQDQYYDLGVDETPGNRDRQYLQFVYRAGHENPRAIRIAEVKGEGDNGGLENKELAREVMATVDALAQDKANWLFMRSDGVSYNSKAYKSLKEYIPHLMQLKCLLHAGVKVIEAIAAGKVKYFVHCVKFMNAAKTFLKWSYGRRRQFMDKCVDAGFTHCLCPSAHAHGWDVMFRRADFWLATAIKNGHTESRLEVFFRTFYGDHLRKIAQHEGEEGTPEADGVTSANALLCMVSRQQNLKTEMASLSTLGKEFMPYVKQLQYKSGMHAHTVYHTYVRMTLTLEKWAKTLEADEMTKYEAAKKAAELNATELKFSASGMTLQVKKWHELEKEDTIKFFSQVRVLDPNQRAAVARNDERLPRLRYGELSTEYAMWWSQALPSPHTVTVENYWEGLKDTFPELYKYATYVLRTPAGTADVEQNFSGLALVDDNRSPMMKSDLVEARTVLRCNADLALVHLRGPVVRRQRGTPKEPQKREREDQLVFTD